MSEEPGIGSRDGAGVATGATTGATTGVAAGAAIGVALVGATAMIGLRWALIDLPLERDEGEYAYIAQRLLSGELPYVHAFNQKPPGVFVAYAAAFLLGGPSVAAVRWLGLLWSLATGLVLAGLTRRLAGPLAGAFALLAFAVLDGDPQLTAIAANTEQFTLLPTALALWQLDRALRGRRGGWLLAGSFMATACWFKPVAATGLLLVGVALCVHAWSAPAARLATWWRGAGAVALGGALVSAPIVAVYAAAGALDPFLDAVFLHNLAYAGAMPLATGLGLLGKRLLV